MSISSKKVLKTGIVIALLFLPVLFFLLLAEIGESHYNVPVFYPKGINESTGDTIYHTVPNFDFIDQNAKRTTEEFFEEKVYVTNYFFTTCLGPCPKMSEFMGVLQDKLKNEDRVLLLSHTVDPLHDTSKVLSDYAQLYDVNYNKWRLVTGNKKQLYEQARKGYFLVATQGDGGENDFIHSQKFVLIDDKKRIRGYYDGTDIDEIERLLNEIGIILRENELIDDHK